MIDLILYKKQNEIKCFCWSSSKQNIFIFKQQFKACNLGLAIKHLIIIDNLIIWIIVYSQSSNHNGSAYNDYMIPLNFFINWKSCRIYHNVFFICLDDVLGNFLSSGFESQKIINMLIKHTWGQSRQCTCIDQNDWSSQN